MAIVRRIGWNTIALWAETINFQVSIHTMSSHRLLWQLFRTRKQQRRTSPCKEHRGQHKVNDPTSCRRNTRIEIHNRYPLPTGTARVGRYCVKSGVLGEIEGEAHNMPRRLRRRLGGPGRRIRCVIAQGGSDRECSINVTGENQNGGNWLDRMVVCLGYRRCDLVYGVCGGRVVRGWLRTSGTCLISSKAQNVVPKASNVTLIIDRSKKDVSCE